jgi:hypothetical protein
MAFKVQNPNRKINHAVLHGGAPGAGKDTLWAPFLWAIGGDALVNVSLVRNEELTSQWGYALETEVMVINELRQSEAKDRRALENQLKPLIAAPPDMLPINRKGLHPGGHQPPHRGSSVVRHLVRRWPHVPGRVRGPVGLVQGGRHVPRGRLAAPA